MTRTKPIAIAVLAIVMLGAGSVAAQSPQEAFSGAAELPPGAAPAFEKSPVATGAFTHAVPIEVPRFRDIAPSLSLSYSSRNTQNGLVGIGWWLSGFDVIERRGPAGAPSYTASDTFWWNGEPLVPSADLGGTHGTKRQSFLRITQSGNSWTITNKAGTRHVFSPIYTTTRGVFRWGLTQVVDTHGNTVNYAWWGDGQDVYPDSVSYNGTSVTFGRQGRSDVETFATGDGVGRTQYRLSSITVTVGGTLLRSYPLSYGTNAAGKSLLVQVGQSFLPPTTIGYHAAPAGTPPRFDAPRSSWGSSSPPTSFGNFGRVEGDFSGDGRTDFLLHYRVGNTLYTYVSHVTGDGDFAAPVSWWWNSTPPLINLSEWRLLAGDFNGDGRVDLLFHLVTSASSQGNNTLYFYVALSNGNGTFTTPSLGYHSFGNTLPAGGCQSILNYGVEIGDYNGDQRDDMRVHCRSGNAFQSGNTVASGIHSHVFLATGTGWFFAPVTWNWSVQTPGAYSLVYYGLQPGDYNGDGRTDMRLHFRNGSSVYSYTALSAGNGSFGSLIVWSTAITPDLVWLENYVIDSGDYNGDRRTDFRLFYRTAGSHHSYTFLSAGNGGFTSVHWSHAGAPAIGNWLQYSDLGDASLAGDYDGDGTTDLVWNYRDAGGTYTYVAYSTANGSFVAPQLVQSASGNFGGYWPTAGDYNGDGRADLRLHLGTGGIVYSTVLAASARRDHPALISSIGYWTGGSTGVTYADHWSGKVLRQLTHADGRAGASVTQTYSFYDPYIKDATEPRDIGFRRAVVWDGFGDYTDTTWYQGTAFPIGMPERVQRRTAAGALMTDSSFTVDQSDGVAPYVRLVTARDEAEYNGDSSYQNLHTGISYDGYGNVTQETFQGGQRVRTLGYRYDWSPYIVSKPTSETVTGAGTGTSVTMGYNNYGDLTSKTIGGLETWQYDYDGIGNQTLIRDPRGYATTTTYSNIYPISVTNPLSQVSLQSWDTVCQVPLSSTDVNSRTTTYGYDGLCRKTREDRPDAGWSTISYLDFGSAGAQRIRTATSDGTSDGLWKLTYFDGLGRPYRVDQEASATTVRVHDARGLVATETTDGVTTSFVHDALGRRSQTNFADGSNVRTTYDDWRTVSHDELGHATTRTMDAFGNVVQIQDPAGTTTLDHDAGDRITLVTDALGYQTGFGYNAAGRKNRQTDPDMGTWIYGHDAAGNVSTQTDARGRTITFSYDPLGRPTQRAVGQKILATLRYDTPGYGDSRGRLVKVTDPTGSTAFFYDSMGRVTQEVRVITGRLYNVWNSYDLAGRPATLTYPDGETIGFSYDAGGRVIRAGNYATSGQYNTRGQLANRTLCNGVSETFGYHPTRNWLTSWTSGSIQSLSLGHNTRGDVTSLGGGPASWGYSYDGLGRLTSSTGPYPQTFSYAANGRMASQTNIGAYSYGSRAHAPTAVNGASMGYDGNGNLLSGGGHVYTYDDENHIATRDGVVTRYNGLGERVQAGNTRFVGTLYEDDGTAPRKHYYFGKARIARRDGPTSVFYYHGDQVGSVGRITDRFRNVVKTQVVSPFGHVVSASGSLTDPFGLAGQRLEGGVYPMGARTMDPELAMFTSPDPSGDADPLRPGKLNRYAYAYNIPTRFIDPTGYAGQQQDPSGAAYREPRDPLLEAMLSGSMVRNPLLLPQVIGESVTFNTGSVTLGLAATLGLELLPGAVASIRSAGTHAAGSLWRGLFSTQRAPIQLGIARGPVRDGVDNAWRALQRESGELAVETAEDILNSVPRFDDGFRMEDWVKWNPSRPSEGYRSYWNTAPGVNTSHFFDIDDAHTLAIHVYNDGRVTSQIKIGPGSTGSVR